MSNEMMDALRRAVNRRVEEVSFGDMMYGDEEFFDASISNDFAGWYCEEELAKHLDFILRRCAKEPPAKVLDAACGHGRYSEMLARQGYEVIGTDISERLVAHLNQKYGGPKVRFEKRSFKELDFSDAFDLIIVLGNSLSLIPREELPQVLRNLSGAVRPEGRLFLELDNRQYFIDNEAGRSYWSAADRWLRLSKHYYDESLKMDKTLDIAVDLERKTVKSYPLCKSLYNQEEISQYLERAGFIPMQWFGDWEGSEVSDSKPSIIVIARTS